MKVYRLLTIILFMVILTSISVAMVIVPTVEPANNEIYYKEVENGK